MQRWQWLFRLLTRRMWFRAALFCIFAVMLALLGSWLAPLIPGELETDLGARAVDNILGVLASSMLAVTTFSLTAMVQAYASATSTITPRAVQLLIDDPTSQNALATFLGSFLFAIVGIIALATGVYGASGRVILFAGTVLVIIVIIVTFLRWIEHVAKFGRVSDTIRRIEEAACEAVRSARPPVAFGDEEPAPRPRADNIHCERIGRVTHVDYGDLSEIAEASGLCITIAALPGSFVDADRPLAFVAGAEASCREQIVGAFTIARNRAFDQDPRLGLVTLAETASRALSPAVNDPGTAISVLESGARVLTALLAPDPDGDRDCDPLPGIVIPAYRMPDLLEDLIRPIARDGAGVIEVAVRIQKTLHALCSTEPRAADDCRAAAADAADRAFAALDNDRDQMVLRQLRATLWRPV